MTQEELLVCPSAQSTVAIQAWATHFPVKDLGALVGEIRNVVQRVVKEGDLHPLEAMLMGQAIALQNLFTNLDAGAGTRYFASGGTSTRGRHTAAGGVFWNIRAERDAKMPGNDFAPPGVFFVGVQGLDPAEAKEGWHVEAIEPTELEPANLHEAQLKRRLEE